MKPCGEDELLETIRGLLDIHYDYGELSEDNAAKRSGAAALSAGLLGHLPSELLEQLREATLNGSKKLLEKLIAQVREMEVSGMVEAGAADGLQELADRYEYDVLTHLLQESSRQ